MTWILLSVGVAIGLWASRKWISVPLWENEAVLRRELDATRRELLQSEMAAVRLSDQVMDDFRDRNVPETYGLPSKYLTPPPGWEVVRASDDHPDPSGARRVPYIVQVDHRTHSDVLFIPHPEDLLK